MLKVTILTSKHGGHMLTFNSMMLNNTDAYNIILFNIYNEKSWY